MSRKNKRNISSIRRSKRELSQIAKAMNVSYSDMTPLKNKKSNFFISYSPKDISFVKQIITHLEILEKEKLINIWSAQEIDSGTDWSKKIDHKLGKADVILLILSTDFLTSNYFNGVEFKKALAMHDAGEATVIPIILKPCEWESTSLASLQVLPRSTEPLSL